MSTARADPGGQGSTDPGLFVPANELPAVRALVTSATAAMDKLEAGKLPVPVILGSIAHLGILASTVPGKTFSLSAWPGGVTRHITVALADVAVLWNALREACDHLAAVAAMAQYRGKRAN